MVKIVQQIYKIRGLFWCLRWRLSTYDHIEELQRLMIPGWEKMRILDAGSGSGLIAGDRCFSGVDVTCLDVSAEAIRCCKQRGLKAVKADIRKVGINFFKSGFDIVWCLNIIEHLEKKEAVVWLDLLEAVVKKQIVILVPLGYFPQDRSPNGMVDQEFYKHRSFWEKEDFSKRDYQCRVLKGYCWDIRSYCSIYQNNPYPVVRDVMWATKSVGH